MLVLGLAGLLAPRAQGQTSGQVMTFSIACQYNTNNLSTNFLAGHVQNVNDFKQITTVLVDTANMVKALAVDNFGTNWVKWIGAQLCYEVDLATGTPAIFMRLGSRQVDVSTNFNSGDGVGTYINAFSIEPSNVVVGGAYAFPTNPAYGNNFANLPLISGLETNYPGTNAPFTNVASLTNYGAFDNLAYLNFTTTNLAFTLIGYSQGTLYHVSEILHGTRHAQTVDDAFIFGAGTFSLNLTTNFLRVTPSTPGLKIDPNVVLATNFTGMAHGTLYIQKPFLMTNLVSPPVEQLLNP